MNAPTPQQKPVTPRRHPSYVPAKTPRLNRQRIAAWNQFVTEALPPMPKSPRQPEAQS